MMGLLKKEKVFPFSGFEGQLLFKGKPAAGAKITRSYELFKESASETIETDQEGHFSFESIEIPFRTPLLAPVEFLSFQDIFVDYNNKEFHIWTSSKRSKQEYAEFGGQRVKVKCEITKEPVGKELPKGLLVTSCEW